MNIFLIITMLVAVLIGGNVGTAETAPSHPITNNWSGYVGKGSEEFASGVYTYYAVTSSGFFVCALAMAKASTDTLMSGEPLIHRIGLVIFLPALLVSGGVFIDALSHVLGSEDFIDKRFIWKKFTLSNASDLSGQKETINHQIENYYCLIRNSDKPEFLGRQIQLKDGSRVCAIGSPSSDGSTVETRLYHSFWTPDFTGTVEWASITTDHPYIAGYLSLSPESRHMEYKPVFFCKFTDRQRQEHLGQTRGNRCQAYVIAEDNGDGQIDKIIYRNGYSLLKPVPGQQYARPNEL